jgi:undecaprenyl-diphosphatase
VDGRLYLAIDHFAAHHSRLGHAVGSIESWSIPVFAAATLALWLLATPGGPRKWKLACGSALAAAALALLANQVVAHLWTRPRPYAAHPDAVLFVARSHDPSFPSDHAAAAFAIAVAVLLFDRLAGGIFLGGAAVIAVGRVIAGAHDPGDVLAGALIGALAAVAVVRYGRPVVSVAVWAAERVTDPLVAPLRRRLHLPR